MPMLKPPHPGEFIRTEIIEPLGLSVTGALKSWVFPGLRCPACLTAKPICPEKWPSELKRRSVPRWTRSCECSPPMTLPAPATESKIRVRRYRPAAMQEFVGIRKERSEFRDPVEYVRGLRRGSRIERLGK